MSSNADMVIYVAAHNDGCLGDYAYIEELYSIFRNDGTYRDKVPRKSKCVTIDYAGDFHLDPHHYAGEVDF